MKDLRELARQYTDEATLRLVHWMRSNNPRASVMAINSLLDRGWDKPKQGVDVDQKVTVSYQPIRVHELPLPHDIRARLTGSN
jgi:hypothetical protein